MEWMVGVGTVATVPGIQQNTTESWSYNSIKLGHFLGQIYIQPVETGQQKHQEHLRYEAYHYEFLQE